MTNSMGCIVGTHNLFGSSFRSNPNIIGVLKTYEEENQEIFWLIRRFLVFPKAPIEAVLSGLPTYFESIFHFYLSWQNQITNWKEDAEHFCAIWIWKGNLIISLNVKLFLFLWQWGFWKHKENESCFILEEYEKRVNFDTKLKGSNMNW